jgi:DEAD/DEAH box helicase domain-containing protein
VKAREIVFAEMVKVLENTIVPNAADFALKYGGDRSLSEALALEGFFPLFGMPVRNAILIHEDPKSGKNNNEYPLTHGKIDRSSDIAISEFAPNSELVKDKKILHCVGVAWPEVSFDRKGNKYINSGDPKNAKTQIVCRSCGTISFTESLICEGCGTAGAKVRKFESWTPPAFVADFYNRVYDGHVDKDSKQVLSFPTGIDLDHPDNTDSTSNYVVSSYPGTLVRTNTNDFEGYCFQKVIRTKLSGLFIANDVGRIETPGWGDASNVVGVTENVALTTERKTDILLVRAKNWPTEYAYAGQDTQYKCRGAWNSLAEILGKSIIYFEDIEPSEISVGIRYESDSSNAALKRDLWGVFIADNLDNGAGYSSNYSTKETFEQLLSYASEHIRMDLTAEKHRSCFGSCYDCLKQYSNRFIHHELDWRLGLDLLDLLAGANPSLAMTAPHWSYVLDVRIGQQFDAFGLKGLKPGKVGDYHILKLEAKGKTYGLVPLHPLTNMEFYMVSQLREELSEQCGADVIFVCPYDLERRPLTQIQRIREIIERRSSIETKV